MSAGTLTLTNNSPTVTGTGTSFTTELAAGDFVVVTVGGIPYTLPVKTVDSGTELTLVSNFTGPTQAGAAWSAVPRIALNMVTAALVAQSAEALRGLNYDKQNWQRLFTGTGDVTIRLPDGSEITGPAWNSFIQALSAKADTSALEDFARKTDLGDSATKDVGTEAGSVAAGDDTRFSTVDGKAGGAISTPITVRGVGLNPKLVASHLDYNPALGGNAIWIVGMTGTENIMKYVSEVTGQYYTLTTVFRVAGQQQFWSQTSTGRYLTPLGELAVQGSDVRIKDDFTPPQEGAWDRIAAIGICEFKYKGHDVTQRGFLAQQMEQVDPVYVFESGKAEDEGGEEFNILNVNDRAVMADMIAVIQELQAKVKTLESQVFA